MPAKAVNHTASRHAQLQSEPDALCCMSRASSWSSSYSTPSRKQTALCWWRLTGTPSSLQSKTAQAAPPTAPPLRGQHSWLSTRGEHRCTCPCLCPAPRPSPCAWPWQLCMTPSPASVRLPCVLLCRQPHALACMPPPAMAGRGCAQPAIRLARVRAQAEQSRLGAGAAGGRRRRGPRSSWRAAPLRAWRSPPPCPTRARASAPCAPAACSGRPTTSSCRCGPR